MDGEIAAAGIEQHAAFDAAIDRADAPRVSTVTQGVSPAASGPWSAAVSLDDVAGRQASECGCWSALTTPPIACRAETQRRRPANHFDLVGGQRIDRHEMIFAEVGRAVGAMPFSEMRTRLTSRPRMIGRLDAPGAKLEPVMPGFRNSRSPSVAAPLRRISSFGTTVTVANWSVTMGSTPC